MKKRENIVKILIEIVVLPFGNFGKQRSFLKKKAKLIKLVSVLFHGISAV